MKKGTKLDERSVAAEKAGADELRDIMATEVLTIEDFQKIFGVGYAKAAELIRQIKFKQDRLKISGRIHIQDYIQYFNLDPALYVNRYVKIVEVPK